MSVVDPFRTIFDTPLTRDGQAGGVRGVERVGDIDPKDVDVMYGRSFSIL
jgi:hypothetical protein